MMYWLGRMHPTVFGFLKMYHGSRVEMRSVSDEINVMDVVSRLDPRAWFNLSHTVGRMQAFGLSDETIAKLVGVHCGIEIQAAFQDYLSRSDDIREFPVRAEALLGEEDEMARKNACDTIKYWLDQVDKIHAADSSQLSDMTQQQRAVPLLGATAWDVRIYMQADSTVERLRDPVVYDRIVKNLHAYIMLIIERASDTADNLCMALKIAQGKLNTRCNARKECPPMLLRDFMNGLKDTPAEGRLIDQLNRYHRHKSAAAG
jgi:hypothetical protein